MRSEDMAQMTRPVLENDSMQLEPQRRARGQFLMTDFCMVPSYLGTFEGTLTFVPSLLRTTNMPFMEFTYACSVMRVNEFHTN